MYTFCPACASKNIRFAGNKVTCADCGFVYFHNTAAATGCVIESGGKVLLLVRAREPAAGKLDLPGGFVDPGEGALEGLRRELREELGWEPPVPPGKSGADLFTFFASFPNKYPYKNILYNTCDLFFTISVPKLDAHDFLLEAEEITAARFVRPEEIDPDDLAFDSTRRAMAAYREFVFNRASG